MRGRETRVWIRRNRIAVDVGDRARVRVRALGCVGVLIIVREMRDLCFADSLLLELVILHPLEDEFEQLLHALFSTAQALSGTLDGGPLQFDVPQVFGRN